MTTPVLDQPAGPAGDPRPAWPLPADESGRLAALHSFGVLDQPRQADLDAAARLAAFVCGTPTAVVNLIDADRQWQAAAYGCEPGEVSRRDSMCARTILGLDVIYTPDARTEPHVADSPFVVGPVGSVRLYAAAPLVTSDGHAIGTVCAFDEQPRALSEHQLSLLADVSAQVVSLFELRRTGAALARAAGRDPLTGLANRRTLELAVASAVSRAERGLGTPSLVMVDLDGFKAVNDAFGHAAGDAVLGAVAERLSRTSRAIDTVARLGGDEFVVLLEHTGGPGAVAALSRLRAGLADLDTGDEQRPVRVDASMGIATYRPGDSVASLMSRADAEMYADKAVRTR